jgi:hypothetical protein
MSVYENPLKEGRVSDPPLSHVDHSGRASVTIIWPLDAAADVLLACTLTDDADEFFYPFLETRSTTSCGGFGIRRKNNGIALDLAALLHS